METSSKIFTFNISYNNILKFLFIGLIFWSILFSFSFIFSFSNDLMLLSPFVKWIFSTVCHQEPQKIISINNNSSLFICSRCTGIYLGILISLLFFLLTNKKIIVNTFYLLSSVALIISDILLYNTGLYSYSKLISFVTGFIFSAILFNYVNNYFLQEEKIK